MPTRYEVPPKLPVPVQADCFQSYLEDLSAIVPREDWQKACELVGKFTARDGLGPLLHRKLEEHAQTVDNWAHDFWLDDMYFRMGLALPVNSNPGMVLRKQHFSSNYEWLRFTAEVMRGAVEYKLLIDAEAIPQQYTRSGEPFCMQQYNNIFHTYRQPGLNQDRRLRFTAQQHCIVATKGQFFQLAVFEDEQIRSAESLAHDLAFIVRHSDSDDAQQLPVGLLTTLDRRRWGETHKLLLEDPVNEKALASIEASLFIVCLDDECQVMSDIDVNEETTTLHEMIHGGGSTAHSRNRWFEKPLQLIVNREGFCGLNYEHSTAEGIPVVAMIESAFTKAVTWKDSYGKVQNGNHTNGGGVVTENGSGSVAKSEPKHLRWSLTPELQDILETTCMEIDRLAGDLELRVYRFDLFGKNIPKRHNMSPDCFVQLALQLAYYKSNGYLVATYESASIRRFTFGRVDVIRAATKQAKSWVEAMCLNGRSHEEKLKLFGEAMTKQTDVMNKAIRGQGVDNYFIALREIGTRETGEVPEVFQDDSFKCFNHFALSTSQVPTTDERTFMGYGPVVSGGYGCSYNLHENQILFCISSWRSCRNTSTKLFSKNLDEGLMEMRELLEHTASSA
ncbi:Choline O-acetyltransferase [Hypsibius exemplaris]|uniref:Choline O-acetyltransferase n=1 Tax=Hypsibius exemplaris TaxID=2072580 RepID=A0A1W0WJJ3_HYPEX|nr:Choline O-acetyltransferase [Hypsibius exemplaris]